MNEVHQTMFFKKKYHEEDGYNRDKFEDGSYGNHKRKPSKNSRTGKYEKKLKGKSGCLTKAWHWRRKHYTIWSTVGITQITLNPVRINS